jgi:hypothetical protein
LPDRDRRTVCRYGTPFCTPSVFDTSAPPPVISRFVPSVFSINSGVYEFASRPMSSPFSSGASSAFTMAGRNTVTVYVRSPSCFSQRSNPPAPSIIAPTASPASSSGSVFSGGPFGMTTDTGVSGTANRTHWNGAGFGTSTGGTAAGFTGSAAAAGAGGAGRRATIT